MSISTLEYALMAGNAYFDTRDKRNRIPYPAYLGWKELEGLNHRAFGGVSGFEATAYIKGNDIVISYAGTYFPQKADVVADAALGIGFAHNQFSQSNTEI